MKKVSLHRKSLHSQNVARDGFVEDYPKALLADETN
jgi:hypothetical protein